MEMLFGDCFLGTFWVGSTTYVYNKDLSFSYYSPLLPLPTYVY